MALTTPVSVLDESLNRIMGAPGVAAAPQVAPVSYSSLPTTPARDIGTTSNVAQAAPAQAAAASSYYIAPPAPVAAPTIAAPTTQPVATPVATAASTRRAAAPAAAPEPMSLNEYSAWMTELQNQEKLKQYGYGNVAFYDPSGGQSWGDFQRATQGQGGRRMYEMPPTFNVGGSNYGEAGNTTMIDPSTGMAIGTSTRYDLGGGVAYRPPTGNAAEDWVTTNIAHGIAPPEPAQTPSLGAEAGARQAARQAWATQRMGELAGEGMTGRPARQAVRSEYMNMTPEARQAIRRTPEAAMTRVVGT